MDEAKKVLAIMDSAHGGCSYCAKDLYEKFVTEFPDFLPLALAEYPSLAGAG